MVVAYQEVILEPGHKSFPGNELPETLSRIGEKCWNVLDEDVEFPVAILKDTNVRHNVQRMNALLRQSGTLLSPHGKTTMSPQLIQMQLDAGAWGITAATSAHIYRYQQFGVRRILHANQLVGRQNIDGVLQMLARDPDLEFYTLVDSMDGLAGLIAGLERKPIGRPLRLLVEVGVKGGRTGLRSADDVFALCETISQSPDVCLYGLECFEGIYSGRMKEHDAAAEALIDELVRLAEEIRSAGFFGTDCIIITAGGSAFFDVVAKSFGAGLSGNQYQLILRSGCYITHDSVHYMAIHDRRGIELDNKPLGLRAALEVWGCVQSRPENGLVIINIGKRDVSYDIDLPLPIMHARPSKGRACHAFGEGYHTKALNDQHLFLEVPPDADIAVGDLVGFGISHPCTTFDKWKTMFVVDDDYTIVSAVETFF